MLSISSPVATKCTLEALLLFVGNPTFHLPRPGPQKKAFLIEGLGEEACPIMVCWHLGWVRKRAQCSVALQHGQGPGVAGDGLLGCLVGLAAAFLLGQLTPAPKKRVF